jgi:hypothetical protein
VARNGKPHYEATYRRAIDEEFLKGTHGSGAYLIKLNDSKKTIDQTSVEIQDISCPPKIDVRELVDCPENGRFHELWPSVDKWGPAAAASNGDAAVKELAGLLKTVLMQKGASETDPVKATLVNWALEQTARERTEERKENSSTALAALLGAVKSILPDQQQQTEKDKVDILDRVWNLVDRVQKRSERSDESKPDAFANIGQMVDLFGKLKTTFAPESPAPAVAVANPDAELWEKIALTISGQVSTIVSSLPGIIAAWKMNGAVPPGRTAALGATPAPGAFDPYANPEAARAFARAQNTQQQPGSQLGSQNPEPPATAGQPGLASDANAASNPMEAGSDMGMVNPAVLISKGLDCLNRGYSGSDFADAVVISDGDLAYRQIVSQIRAVGVSGVLQLATSRRKMGNSEQD